MNTPQSSALAVIVVGIGCDGWSGLSAMARDALEHAPTIYGSQRQISMLDPSLAERSVPWQSPMSQSLAATLQELHQTSHTRKAHPPVILASGDPMCFGIGTQIVEFFGKSRVRILPHVSSITLARAELGWSQAATSVISVCSGLHGATQRTNERLAEQG